MPSSVEAGTSCIYVGLSKNLIKVAIFVASYDINIPTLVFTPSKYNLIWKQAQLGVLHLEIQVEID